MEQDMRAVRTKGAIREAFLALLSEVGFANVTVVRIAQRANVSRKTFYDHYADVYDLLLDCCVTLVPNGSGDQPVLEGDGAAIKLYSFIVRELSFCRDNPAFAEAVSEALCNSRYLYKLEQQSTELVRSYFEPDRYRRDIARMIPDEFLSRYSLSATLAIWRHWIEEGMREPVELIAWRMAYMGYYVARCPSQAPVDEDMQALIAVFPQAGA